MKDVLPLAMLAIVMIAGYFLGRRAGLKKNAEMEEKFNNLQKLHAELLQNSWLKEPSLGTKQGYWEAEEEFMSKPDSDE